MADNGTAPSAATRPLTAKQRIFIKAKAKGMSGLDAAMLAYDVSNANVARNIASDNLTKPNVKAALEKAFEKHQITPEAITKPIADALTAEREVFNKDGDIIGTSKDHNVRLKAAGLAAKLMGVDAREAAGNTFVFNNGGSTQNFIKQ